MFLGYAWHLCQYRSMSPTTWHRHNWLQPSAWLMPPPLDRRQNSAESCSCAAEHEHMGPAVVCSLGCVAPGTHRSAHSVCSTELNQELTGLSGEVRSVGLLTQLLLA